MKSNWKSKFVHRNANGFSLVEVMVVTGIMGIVGLGFATMVANISTDVRSFDEKTSIQSLQMQMANVLTNQQFCRCFFGSNTFNYNTTSWNGFPRTFESSFNPSCAPVGSPVFTTGSKIGSSNLKPTDMELQSIVETTTLSGNFSAQLSVQFDSALLTRPRKPIQIPIHFSVNMADPAGARNLVSCSSNNNPVAVPGLTSSRMVLSPFTRTNASASCATDEFLASCLVEVNSADGKSIFFQNHVRLLGTPGHLVSCTSNMFDSDDYYRLVLVCMK